MVDVANLPNNNNPPFRITISVMQSPQREQPNPPIIGTIVVMCVCVFSTGACDILANPVGVPDAYFEIIADSLNDAPALDLLNESFVFESIPDRIGHHGATLAILDDGRLMTAWYSYRGPEELDGASIFTAFKEANATDWSAPMEVPDLPSPAANPLLIVRDGRVQLFFAHAPFQWWSSSVWLTESDDVGATWSAARQVALPAGANLRNPPIQLGNGTTLLPAYSDFWLNALVLRASDTDGATWNVNAVYGPDEDILLQPALVELSEGTLLMAGRNRGGGNLLYATSADYGATWTGARRGKLPNPDSALALTQLRDGRLLIIFNDSDTQRTPLVAMVSSDDGVSWLGRTVLADGAGAFSYPSVLQTTDGMLHVTYSRNRDQIVYQTWRVSD